MTMAMDFWAGAAVSSLFLRIHRVFMLDMGLLS